MKTSLKRQYRGIEGYFYSSGNKKLTAQPGIVDEAKFETNYSVCSSESGVPYLKLFISKRGHTGFTFELWDTHDILDFLKDYNVQTPPEFNKLPVRERLITVYSHKGVNYGINTGF